MKKSFILYKDFSPCVFAMTDEQAGKFLKAIYHYQCKTVRVDGEYEVGKELELLFMQVVSTFERDEEKYRSTCANRSKAGIKGAKQKLAKAGKRKHKVATQADSDSDSERESVSDNKEKNSGVVDLAKQENKATATSSIAERDAEFLSLFNSKLSKKFRVMPTKASHQLTARLKEGYSMAEILSAAKACSQTEHHRKNTQHLTPEFITRGDKLQMYADMEDTTGQWIQDRVGGRGVENMMGQGVNAEGKTNQQWKEEQNVSTK